MSKLIALFQFLLVLCGFNFGDTSFTDRISIDGIDTLVSKADVQAGIARFSCVRSASGQCHYTLFSKDCAPTPQAATQGNCAPRPIRRFAVASGDSQQITGLPEFRLCVDADDASPTPDCRVPKPIAQR